MPSDRLGVNSGLLENNLYIYLQFLYHSICSDMYSKVKKGGKKHPLPMDTWETGCQRANLYQRWCRSDLHHSSPLPLSTSPFLAGWPERFFNSLCISINIEFMLFKGCLKQNSGIVVGRALSSKTHDWHPILSRGYNINNSSQGKSQACCRTLGRRNPPPSMFDMVKDLIKQNAFTLSQWW